MSGARTLFLGSGAFAVPILAAAAALPEVELVGIVTAPSRRSGRGLPQRPSPVAESAAAAFPDVPVLTPTRLRSTDALASVVALQPALLLLADYGRIVPAEWLNVPSVGALNVHPSLLPRHRGATPVPSAILAGDAETGTTLMRMDEGLDTGPLVQQRPMPLRGDETTPELEERLAALGAAIVRDALPAWLRGELPAVPQPEAGATLTRPLRREDGRLDARRSATELERQVRAYQPWPGSFVETADGGRLVVWRARVLPAGTSGTGWAGGEGAVGARETDDAQGTGDIGTLVRVGRGLGISTPEGTLELLDVQRAGGRRMSGEELVRGRPAWLGERAVAAG